MPEIEIDMWRPFLRQFDRLIESQKSGDGWEAARARRAMASELSQVEVRRAFENAIDRLDLKGAA